MGGGRPFCRRSRSFSLSSRSAERECGEWCRRSRERERRCRVRRVREVEREHLRLGDLGSEEDQDGDEDDEALWPFYFNSLFKMEGQILYLEPEWDLRPCRLSLKPDRSTSMSCCQDKHRPRKGGCIVLKIGIV